MLQDLIGPYDNLPAKIDSTAFVCQDYEGIQPASISYKVVHEPSYGGHADSLLVYLKSHLALPDTMKSEHSWELQFVVGKDGRLSSVGVSSNKKDDGEEAIASQLTEAFEQMPAWQPLDIAGLGTQKFVETYKIQFVPYTVPTYSAKTNEDDRIYEKAETVPEFPGGNRTYLEWLYEHIKYPPLCREQGIQGQVIVDFVVNKDGSISDVKTRRSPDPNLSEEAERVIKSMPKWKPATIGGKPVRIRMTAPVIFRLH